MNAWNLDELRPIQRTLAIPLVGRAHAHTMFPALGFSDPAAAQILRQLRYTGMHVLARDRKIVWGTVLRTQAFDEVTSEFAARFPGATAVSLGVGLCTRALRHASLRWVEVDVPEVIAARDQLVARTVDDERGANTTRIATDLTDPDAIDRVLDRALEREGPVLVIAEGLLMFLSPEDQRRVLSRLDARLPPGSRLVFDYLHPIIPRLTPFHGSIRVTGARYLSGFVPRRDVRAFARLVPDGLYRFVARLGGPLRLLQLVLGFVARSPLYEIGSLRIPTGNASV